jgi:cytidylate kinase
MLITISREFGAGGSLVAGQAARALGWRLVDNDFVARVAERAGLPEATVALSDERAPGFREWLLRALARAAPELFAPVTESRPAELEEAALVRVTEGVVADLAAEGRVVLVGRAAPAVLGRKEDALHVRVVAPKAERIRAVMARQALAPAEAQRLMEDTDRNRQRYHREYYDRDWADPAHFHLVLNTGLLGYEGAGNVIVDWAHRMGWDASPARDPIPPPNGRHK